jgi:NADH-quinone oxidoreductase subunit E
MSARTRPITTTEGVRPFAFSEAALAECRAIMARYPEGRSKSALLPILHIAQAENDGWLSVNAMDAVADLMGLRHIEVYEVASFYSMFNLHPVGTYVLDVCRTTPCMLRGSDAIIDHLRRKLGVEPGDTTADGMFTLKTVECLGSCGTGPMLQCGAAYHEDLTIERVDALIDQLRERDQRTNYTDR